MPFKFPDPGVELGNFRIRHCRRVFPNGGFNVCFEFLNPFCRRRADPVCLRNVSFRRRQVIVQFFDFHGSLVDDFVGNAIVRMDVAGENLECADE